MSRRLRGGLLLGSVISIVAFAIYVLYMGASVHASPLPIPSPLPLLKARDMNGEEWTSEQMSGGKTVYIYVEKECPACNEELLQWGKRLNEPDLEFLVELVIVSRRSYEREHLDNIIGADVYSFVHDYMGSIMDSLRVRFVPSIFYVDESDTLQYHHTGTTDDSILEKLKR